MRDADPEQALPATLVALQQQFRETVRAPLGELLPSVYQDLRCLAASYFAGRRGDQTLQPTALVHEVYAKLVAGEANWSDRAHFLALAATVMRQVLADHARRRSRRKRGARWGRVTLSAVPCANEPTEPTSAVDLVALDEALTKLAELDERQARIVELRFLAGLSIADVADLIGCSRRTVELEWRGARAWLRRELEEASGK